MKQNFSTYMIYLILGFFSITLSSSSCSGKKDETTGQYLLPVSYYTINGLRFEGQGAYNPSLKAIEIPCSNNNTIRMYVSDSFKVSGAYNNFYEKLKIVGYQSAGHLKRLECYLEVTTSTSDTWLSTGAGDKEVFAYYENYRANYADEIATTFSFSDAPVQHFTSVPLTEIGKVSATFKVK